MQYFHSDCLEFLWIGEKITKYSLFLHHKLSFVYVSELMFDVLVLNMLTILLKIKKDTFWWCKVYCRSRSDCM